MRPRSLTPHSEMRREIVRIVSDICQKHDLDYRAAWKLIYKEYGDRYHIYPDLMYKFSHATKLDFLEGYENLYHTLSKMKSLVEELLT